MRAQEITAFLLDRMNANAGNTDIFNELQFIVEEIQKKPIFPDSPEDRDLKIERRRTWKNT